MFKQDDFGESHLFPSKDHTNQHDNCGSLLEEFFSLGQISSIELRKANENYRWS